MGDHSEIRRRFIMSVNPLAAKIANPYARALYDFSVEQNIMHQVTADFQTLKSQLNSETFKFLMVLVKRERINLLSSVIISYLDLVYKTASVQMIEVSEFNCDFKAF